MLIKTKHFGEIQIEDDKIITFDDGILGFSDYKKYTIVFDSEDENPKISWLQSVEEAAFALPVISPLLVKEDYAPTVNDELLEGLGELNDENLVILLALTVPKDLTKMTANLKAPFIINSDTKKGIQIIAENPEFEIKYNVYDVLQKEKKGDDVC